MQPESKEHILLFTRYPVVGKCKTRMIAHLGPEGSAVLQKELTEHVTKRLQELGRICPVRPFVWYTYGSERSMEKWLGPDFTYKKQAEGSLGEKMAAAFMHSFNRHGERAVLIGSDCPGIDVPLLLSALQALHHNELVLGPAMDGGYYLIALRNSAMPRASCLFDRTLDWGEPSLFQQTMRLAREAGLSCATLPPLPDIDVPADLVHWKTGERVQ